MAQLLCRHIGGVEEDSVLVGAASPDFAAVSTLHIPRRIIIMVLVRMRAQDTTGYLKSRSIFNHLLTKMEFLLDWASQGFIINQPGLHFDVYGLLCMFSDSQMQDCNYLTARVAKLWDLHGCQWAWLKSWCQMILCKRYLDVTVLAATRLCF